MSQLSSKASFFLYFFQEFYREVLIQREIAAKSIDDEGHISLEDSLDDAASEDSLVREAKLPEGHVFKEEDDEDDLPLVDNPGKPEPHQVEREMLADRIQNKFITMFEKFSLRAQNQPGEFAGVYFQDFLYAMVALLDEVFLSFKWHGQNQWRNNLMEKRFFHTQVAGELFFKKVEDLIHENHSTKVDLAAIYLMIIALGFRGKYRGEDDDGQLNWYREQLYILVNKHPSNLFQPGREQLIEESYDHTISIASVKALPNLKNWVIAFSSVVIIYMIVSSFLWYGVVSDLDDIIGQIITQAQNIGLS